MTPAINFLRNKRAKPDGFAWGARVPAAWKPQGPHASGLGPVAVERLRLGVERVAGEDVHADAGGFADAIDRVAELRLGDDEESGRVARDGEGALPPVTTARVDHPVRVEEPRRILLVDLVLEVPQFAVADQDLVVQDGDRVMVVHDDLGPGDLGAGRPESGRRDRDHGGVRLGDGGDRQRCDQRDDRDDETAHAVPPFSCGVAALSTQSLPVTPP